VRRIPPGISRLTLDQMARIQAELAPRVRVEPLHADVQRIAGVDVAYTDHQAVAAAVLLDAKTLDVLEEATATRPLEAEYHAGLLSFRELPAALDALAGLSAPDLLFCDGHGLAHPRRFGLACHIGVLADLPSIGVAKGPFAGEGEEAGPDRGATTPQHLDDEEVGRAVRTRAQARCVYVSVGHRITLDEAVAWTLRTATESRIPQPTRLADQRATRALRSA
jgi:deoxyribonuclease V